MLERRLSLSPEQIESASQKITDKIESLSSFKSAGTVLFYYPFRNEADMTALIKKSFRDKTVCLPRIENAKRTMTARRVRSLADLHPGRYGILSPPEDAQMIAPDEIDFVIVPLVAYDESLHRIGYGGGYYDGYLLHCVNAVKCGAAYSFQKTDKIISENHDHKLDMIVTEV